MKVRQCLFYVKSSLMAGVSWDFGPINRNRQKPGSLVFKSRLGLLLSVCLGARGKLLHLFLLIAPGEQAGTAKHQRRRPICTPYCQPRGLGGVVHRACLCGLSAAGALSNPPRKQNVWGILHIIRAILSHLISLFPCHRDCFSSLSDSTS